MPIETEVPGFACSECNSRIVAFDAPLTRSSEVRCCGCGSHQGTWDAFDRHLEALRTVSLIRRRDADPTPRHRTRSGDVADQWATV